MSDIIMGKLKFKKNHPWYNKSRLVKRVEGFRCYIMKAFVSLWHPELADLVMYKALSDQFEVEQSEADKMLDCTVKEIIKKHITSNGFDGLYSDENCCACIVDDFAPCDCEYIMNCNQGYLSKCTCGEHGFIIGKTKNMTCEEAFYNE